MERRVEHPTRGVIVLQVGTNRSGAVAPCEVPRGRVALLALVWQDNQPDIERECAWPERVQTIRYTMHTPCCSFFQGEL